MKKWIAIVAGIIGALLVYLGISMKMSMQSSIAIIGGADGPTSIFIAGKIRNGTILAVGIIGVILILGIIWFFRKMRK